MSGDHGGGGLSFRIMIAPANMARGKRWGDYFFASSLQRAFEAEGHSARIVARDGWYDDVKDGEADLFLRGFGGFEPIAGRPSLMWIISHPGNIPPDEMKLYDHVFCASSAHRRPIARAIGRFNVSTLLQATDPEIMKPHADPVRSDLLFVGINRRGGRPSLKHAAAAGYDVDLYGAGWADHPDFGKWRKADLIPNPKLGLHYAGARAVLNDHWRDMRLSGYISNRVFDVLACAAPLVSDRIKGLPEDFAPFIYTWSDADGFRAAVEAALGEGPEKRAERLAMSEKVRAEHSFQARVRRIAQKVHEIIGQR